MPHAADVYNERMSIRKRPPDVQKRTEIGHWEGDTVYFTHRTKQNLTVLVERKSRYTKLRRNTFKDPEQVNNGIVDMLITLPPNARRSVTLDLGTEFNMPFYLRYMLGVEVWYCEPARPQQKGTVENTNGRLRRFMPKRFEIERASDSDIDWVENAMNDTPRKCLGYYTPKEIFAGYLRNFNQPAPNCCT
jgi:IS30 family transposase